MQLPLQSLLLHTIRQQLLSLQWPTSRPPHRACNWARAWALASALAADLAALESAAAVAAADCWAAICPVEAAAAMATLELRVPDLA